MDNRGNLYAADYLESEIRLMTPVGTNWQVSMFAGQYNIQGSSNGVATNALFNYLTSGIAADNAGNVYVADFDNNLIREITSAQVVTTMAGSLGIGSTDGTGSDARFDEPVGVAMDNAGNIYVADQFNHTIRKITAAGVTSTIAGEPGVPGYAQGAGSDARFFRPAGVAVDNAGNVYVADSENNAIRMVTPADVVSTVAGSTNAGHADGTNETAQFFTPEGVAVDAMTNLYVADAVNCMIRKITRVGTNWVVRTIAGGLTTNFIGEVIPNSGSSNGVGTNALFSSPYGIAVDSATNLYVADFANETIRKITPSGTNWVTTTLAGQVRTQGSADGFGTNAQFGSPTAISVENASANLYVSEDGNATVRLITPVGTNWLVSTIGGLATNTGSADGTGMAARFSFYPGGIAADNSGNVYVADSGNNTIRKGVFGQYTPTNSVALTRPANNATLVVTLSPKGALLAGASWRFPWELGWRPSGSAATNLVPNINYAVEFSPVPGYLAIPSLVTNYVAGGPTNYVTGTYYPTITSVDNASGGSLQVVFQANPPGGAGWRLLGSTNDYLPPGYVTNLLPGTYLIQCAPLSNFAAIPTQSIQILPGTSNVIQELYQPSQSQPGGFITPSPVPSGEISDLNDYPFGYNGQLETDIGFGSGFAVQTNVVLTAAHLIFNDQTLSYANQAWWYFQEEAPTYVPQPQAASGWVVLTGYASARTNDLNSGLYTAGQSSPQSRNDDVAALYFQSAVAGGGYGGYLPSDATPNVWLTSKANKMLVGYPVDSSMFQNVNVVPGQMYATSPQPYPLTLATDPVNDQQVYTASWFLSYPGNSGGPFYVELNGYYYPAGVYLGTLLSGTVPYGSAVHAIDSNVVNLINLAQTAVTSGTNQGGGGVITIQPAAGITNNPGGVEMTITPPAAVLAGASWKFVSLGSDFWSTQNPSALAVNSTNILTLQFTNLNGWNVPSNQTVSVSPGDVTPITAAYTVAVSWPQPGGITYGTALGSAQLDATALVAGNFVYSPPGGTVLNPGSNTLAVTFTPGDQVNYGGPSITNTTLFVSSSPVISSARISGGSVTLTWLALTNRQYQIQSKTSLSQGGWTTLGGNITASNILMTVSEPVGTNTRQFYRIALLP